MKLAAVILVFSIILSFNYSCNEKEYLDSRPQLKIIVKNASNVLVNEADVVLFNSEDDFFNKKDSITSSKTDTSGACLFSNLKEKAYFFHVRHGAATNLWSVNSVDTLLTGVRVVVYTTIHE